MHGTYYLIIPLSLNRNDLESMQRKGIAKQLVTCLEHFCLTEGYSKVRLSTLGPMVGAVALYRACGYALVDERIMGKGAGVFQLQTFEKVICDTAIP